MYVVYYTNSESYERFVNVVSTVKLPLNNVKMKRCSDKVSNIESNIMSKFSHVKDETWNLYVPCGYTYVENELKTNDYFNYRNDGVVLGIQGADSFAAKDRIWNMLLEKYGRLRAQIYMPETWVTYDKNQMQSFYDTSREDVKVNANVYIMKKNIQQQQGLHIFTDPSEAVSAFDNGYVVIQRVLRDPYIIDGRKINLRVYVLLTCNQTTKSLHIYDDGFVYYSKVPYKNGLARDEIITTGYIAREVYEKNPLTTKDFYKHIFLKHGASVLDNFIKMRNYVFSGFMDAAKTRMCENTNNVTFAQSFGVDIQPNSDLTDIKIIEWNKGQSLEIMDQRDGMIKQKMIDDIYRTLNFVKDGIPSGFVKIWESK